MPEIQHLFYSGVISRYQSLSNILTISKNQVAKLKWLNLPPVLAVYIILKLCYHKKDAHNTIGGFNNGQQSLHRKVDSQTACNYYAVSADGAERIILQSPEPLLISDPRYPKAEIAKQHIWQKASSKKYLENTRQIQGEVP
jgi:hypothetical protein